MTETEVKINALIYTFSQQADFFEQEENRYKAEADEAHNRGNRIHERSCFITQIENAERKFMSRQFVDELNKLLEVYHAEINE